MAFDAAGNLYVANGAEFGRIRVVEPGGLVVREIGGVLNDPDGVAFDATGAFADVPGSVLVGAADEIWAIHPDESMERLFGPNDGLSNVQALALDADGRLLIADQGSMAVFCSSPGGLVPFISIWRPFDVTTDSSGDIVVGSEGGIDRYEADGTWLEHLTSDPGYVTGVAFAWRGNLFASGHGTPELHKFTPGGAHTAVVSALELDGGKGVEYGPDDFLFLAEAGTGCIWRITPEPGSLSLLGLAALTQLRRRRT